MAFQHIEPDIYREISKLLSAKREVREQYVEKVIRVLQEDLAKADIKAEVTGRPSTYTAFTRRSRRMPNRTKRRGRYTTCSR